MKKCEVCNKQLHPSNRETVCNKCDKRITEEHERALMHAAFIASKRKCGRCGVSLKPTRHFNCEECVPAGIENGPESVLSHPILGLNP